MSRLLLPLYCLVTLFASTLWQQEGVAASTILYHHRKPAKIISKIESTIPTLSGSEKIENCDIHPSSTSSILSLRGGKTESLLSSLLSWIKSFLGLESKSKAARYGKKSTATTFKSKTTKQQEVSSQKSKVVPKKSAESPGQGRLQRVSCGNAHKFCSIKS